MTELQPTTPTVRVGPRGDLVVVVLTWHLDTRVFSCACAVDSPGLRAANVLVDRAWVVRRFTEHLSQPTDPLRDSIPPGLAETVDAAVSDDVMRDISRTAARTALITCPSAEDA